MRLLFREAWAIKTGTGLYKSRSDDLSQVLWHGRFFFRKKDAQDYLLKNGDWILDGRVVKIRLTVDQIQ